MAEPIIGRSYGGRSNAIPASSDTRMDFLLLILDGIPIERRAAWLASHMPRTWALLSAGQSWSLLSDLGDEP
jgi:hypothetical protein